MPQFRCSTEITRTRLMVIPPLIYVFFFKRHNIERTATFKKLIKQSPTSYFLFGGFVGFFSILEYVSSNSISFQTVFHQGYNFGRAQEGWARVWLDAKSCQSNRGSTWRDPKILFFLLGQQVIPVIIAVLQVGDNLQTGLGIMKAAQLVSPLSTVKCGKIIWGL